MNDHTGTLFPPVVPCEQGRLSVSDLHTLHWEISGAADGLPVLVLHGGPGGSIKGYYRQLLDPETYQTICYDQRGCGQSTPYGELAENTTADLVEDIEKLREHLGLRRWWVLGGSWGATLALAYAQAYPESVRGLVVSGVFLGNQSDRDWWWGLSRYVYPDAWDYLLAFLPPDERDSVRQSYLERVLCDDPDIYRPAAMRLMLYEAQLLDPTPSPDLLQGMQRDADTTITMARLFCHYDRAASFLAEDALIQQADRLVDVPGHILAGRGDMCTPPLSAWRLSNAWPAARLSMLPLAGHRWQDPVLLAAIRGAFGALCGK